MPQVVVLSNAYMGLPFKSTKPSVLFKPLFPGNHVVSFRNSSLHPSAQTETYFVIIKSEAMRWEMANLLRAKESLEHIFQCDLGTELDIKGQ